VVGFGSLGSGRSIVIDDFTEQDVGSHLVTLIATDGDGLADGLETGTHVFVSWWSSDLGTDPDDTDSDDDGILDGTEYLYRTNPVAFDTDRDGLSDGEEVSMGSDPLDPTSPVPEPGALLLQLTALLVLFGRAAMTARRSR